MRFVFIWAFSFFMFPLFAGPSSVCDGNLCIALKEAVKKQDFVLSSQIYEELIENFETSKHIDFVSWSTMIDLTKLYIQFTILQGNVETSLSALNRLLQKSPPEALHDRLLLLRESLNPNKLSLGRFLKKIEHFQNRKDTFLPDSRDVLFVTTYKYCILDYLDSLRQEANKAVFLNDYEKALELYSRITIGLKQGDFPLSKHDELLVLTEIDMLNKKTVFKRVHESVNIEEKIIAFSNYLVAKQKYSQILQAYSKKSDNNRESSSELMRNLLTLASHYYNCNKKDKAKELLMLVVKKAKHPDRSVKLGLLKLMLLYVEEKQVELLHKLVDTSRHYIHEYDDEYAEYCLFRGIAHYMQRNFCEAQNFIKLAIGKPDVLGMKMPLALQYLGYTLLAQADTRKIDKHLLLKEAYKVFVLLFKNWGHIEGLLGCYFIQSQGEADLCEELSSDVLLTNSREMSLFQRQLIFNLHLVSSSVSGVVLNETERANDFHNLRILVSSITKNLQRTCEEPVTGICMAFEKIIVSLLRQNTERYMSEIEIFIQKFLNNKMLTFLEEASSSLALSLQSTSPIFWYMSLFKDIYKNNFHFSDLRTDEYSRNIFPEQQDMLACIQAAYFLRSHSKQELLRLLKDKITPRVSYAQGFLRLLFLDHVSEDFVKHQQQCFEDWPKQGYFSEEIFFKAFPLSCYIRGDKQAICHLKRFVSLFPDSQLIPIVFYFLGIYEQDFGKSLHYLTTALEDYSDINLASDHRNPFTYFFYKTKLDLSFLLTIQNEEKYVTKAIEFLENIKEDFLCLKHPLIESFKEKHSTLQLELDADYLLTYCFLKIGNTEQLKTHLYSVLQKYTLFFEEQELKPALCCLWRLQGELMKREDNIRAYTACMDVVDNVLKASLLGLQLNNYLNLSLLLSPLL